MKSNIVMVLVLLFNQFVSAQSANVHWNLEKGIALQGYDAVAYHTKKKAVRGKQTFSLAHGGAIWYFESSSNREIFRKSPASYEPAYGGWCAFAMGDYGKKVEVDPETFKIIDGKLYLFYNKYFNNTLSSWNKNETALKRQGDSNWAKLIQ